MKSTGVEGVAVLVGNVLVVVLVVVLVAFVGGPRGDRRGVDGGCAPGVGASPAARW